MKKIIQGQTYQKERALYRLQDTELLDCIFAGPEDGESPLKHAKNIRLEKCHFSLRYPIWHVENFEMNNCELDKDCRAALWYCFDGRIENSTLNGIKALRDCQNVLIENCKIDSPEFGWKCRGITARDTKVSAEYLFLDCQDIRLTNVKQRGKYSFQYCRDLVIENSILDTKDAFWHSENVTVRRSYVKGEYLAWFSNGLTLEDCVIEGTQPLCFCENLVLKNCKMISCDLAFEASNVDADVIGFIDSVKNPLSGKIVADSYGEIILDEPSITQIIKR